MSAEPSVEPPFHLQGNFAPVTEEVTAIDLPVEGAIPPELNGLFVRNGSNPRSGQSPHWFFGDGMLHGVRLEGGRVRWYRNRYVRTTRIVDPDANRMPEPGVFDRRISFANTHVIRHAGRILALEEQSFPWIVDGELATLGPTDFGGRLTEAFTAHPKICAETGELLAFGYGFLEPWLTSYRVDREGELVQVENIDVPGPTMMHDFAITTNYTLFLDLPIVFDLELAMQGQMPFHWSDTYGARIGIMPRRGGNADVRWFEVEPCYIFHGLNAYEDDDGEIVYDASRAAEMWREPGELGGAAGGGNLSLHRYRFDLEQGTVKEETLEDRAIDFPKLADARVGKRHRHGYFLSIGTGEHGGPRFRRILKRDFERGTLVEHAFPDACVPTEASFAPAPGSDASSDEGWLLSFVHDEATGRSALWILDATDLTKPPVAKVALPQRVPYGFHGSWLPDV